MSLQVRSKPLQHDPLLHRDLIVGPAAPQSPYPIKLKGWVERGFGRGSKELGCPTANLPDSSILPYSETLSTGVYYGFAAIVPSSSSSSALPTSQTRTAVHPMVMSIGWNPFYNNDKRTAEVHILHEYEDFYGQEIRVIMLGFVRPEYNYDGLDALIKDINMDKEVARASVMRPDYAVFANDPFFFAASDLEPMDPSLLLKREEPKKLPAAEMEKL